MSTLGHHLIAKATTSSQKILQPGIELDSDIEKSESLHQTGHITKPHIFHALLERYFETVKSFLIHNNSHSL